MKRQMYYNNRIYLSKGNKIFVNKKQSIEKLEYLTIDQLNFMNHFEIYNRALRHGIHNFYKINDDIDCVIIKGKILFYINKKLSNILILNKGSRPLRSGILFRKDHIIYNEYHGNRNREPINIYKYNFIENKKEIIYTFHNIRHIHCIEQNVYDPNNIFIGTGDLDEECGIYNFNLKTQEMKKIGGGSQIWRTVSILQKNNSLYWGTDDPVGKNYIVKYSLNQNKLEKVQEIDGPAYYSTITKKNDMFIATSIEDKNNHRAIIYRNSSGSKWDKYLEFKKDIFHTKYFGYGIIEFINNQEELDNLIFNLVGLTKL